MFVKEIRLRNFRNYEKAELCFKPGVSLVKGANGQGKSNLLEAIYCLCFAGSFRPARDEDMVYWNKPFYFLQGTVYSNNCYYRLEIGYALAQKRKVVKINGTVEKKGRFGHAFPVVFFVPEDLEIVRRGPEERRRFLDRELCQLSPVYAADLSAYRRALMQKNRLLKEKKNATGIKELLEPWNRQLIQYGSRIISRRSDMIRIWNNKAAKNYSVLFHCGQNLQLDYMSSTVDGEFPSDLEYIAENMSREIKMREEEERVRGYALVGPHKDDLLFLLDKREARKFASHGQQRSAVIALKAAQVQYYREMAEKPLFMIDDIFSELDELRRRQCLLLFSDAAQVFMTVTGERNYLENYPKGQEIVSFFCVQEGKIREVGHGDQSGLAH
ncbi:MAG: DNA replication/repair protein RecF [Bacillota bacterium]